MNEIKFRAWDKNREEMLDYEGIFNSPNFFDNSNLMQYTGLKDKNGKMIYEGDIVKDKNFVDSTTGNVLFKDGTFTVDWGFTKDNSEILLCIDNKNCEIIGNIYENKDLIK